jgi:hypothetical protein
MQCGQRLFEQLLTLQKRHPLTWQYRVITRCSRYIAVCSSQRGNARTSPPLWRAVMRSYPTWKSRQEEEVAFLEVPGRLRFTREGRIVTGVLSELPGAWLLGL